MVATSSLKNINDFAGADDAGFGGVNQTYANTGPISGAPADLHFEGLIGAIRLYSDVLTQEEAEQNFIAITQDAAAARGFLSDVPFTLSDFIGTTEIAIDDDDPATSPSPLFTTTNVAEIPEGCFTTAANVTQTTVFTVTATGPGGPSSVSETITVGGDGTTYPESVLDAGPIAYYRFNEPSESDGFFDSSGNGYHSKNFNNVPVGGVTGAVDGALELTGNHGVTTSLTMNPQDPDEDDAAGDVDPDGIEGFTVEAVFQPDFSDPDFFGIVSQANGSGVGRSNWEISPTRQNRTFMGGTATVAASQNLDQAWCHHAFVCEYQPATEDYTITFYRDGAVDESFDGILTEASDGDWVLFQNKAEGVNFQGKFDELAVYDRVLSPAEIATHSDAVTANSQITLMAFGLAPNQGDTISIGGSAELFYKIGGGNTATIDNGVGTVGPGSGTVSVSPAATTT